MGEVGGFHDPGPLGSTLDFGGPDDDVEVLDEAVCGGFHESFDGNVLVWETVGGLSPDEGDPNGGGGGPFVMGMDVEGGSHELTDCVLVEVAVEGTFDLDVHGELLFVLVAVEEASARALLCCFHGTDAAGGVQGDEGLLSLGVACSLGGGGFQAEAGILSLGVPCGLGGGGFQAEIGFVSFCIASCLGGGGFQEDEGLLSLDVACCFGGGGFQADTPLLSLASVGCLGCGGFQGEEFTVVLTCWDVPVLDGGDQDAGGLFGAAGDAAGDCDVCCCHGFVGPDACGGGAKGEPGLGGTAEDLGAKGELGLGGTVEDLGGVQEAGALTGVVLPLGNGEAAGGRGGQVLEVAPLVLPLATPPMSSLFVVVTNELGCFFSPLVPPGLLKLPLFPNVPFEDVFPLLDDGCAQGLDFGWTAEPFGSVDDGRKSPFMAFFQLFPLKAPFGLL